MSNFKTDVKGSVVLIYKADDLKTPIATVNSADDVEDVRGQIWDAVQAAYNAGYAAAKSEPLKDDARAIRAVERAYNDGFQKGKAHHAAQMRALIDLGKRSRRTKK